MDNTPPNKFTHNAANSYLKLLFLIAILLISSVASAAPGDKKWEFATGGNVDCNSPAISSDDTIYFSSYDMKIYAMSTDGSKKWEYATGGLARSAPAVDKDGNIYAGAYDQKLHALYSNGTKIWEYLTGGAVCTSPALGSDGTIYFGSYDNKCYALNLDGTKKWEYNVGGAMLSSPAIGSDGTIYIGSPDKKLYALNPDGSKKWEFTTGDSILCTPSLADDGTIYIGSFDDKFYALNPDGTKKWEYQTGGDISSSAVIDNDGTIYFGSYDNKLYALYSDGTKKWDFTTGGQIQSTPAIGSDGKIYFGSEDGKLYALNSSGAKEWDFTTGDKIKGSPAIGSDGTIYIGSDDDKLYAIEGSSSGLLASYWPKFQQNRENSGRKTSDCIVPSPTQASGVTVGVLSSCTKNMGETDLSSRYNTSDFSPKSGVSAFNATINSNGATATFMLSSSSIPTGKVADLTLMKFYDTNGTSRAYKAYSASGPEYNLDGYWWMTDADGNHMALTDDTTLGTPYYIYFVIKDNGEFDEDRDLGEIADPTAIGVSPSGSSSSGCTVNSSASLGIEWGLLGLSVILLLARGRRNR